jgi:chaperonin cofactor prefoldin
MAAEHDHSAAVQKHTLQQQAVELDLALKELAGAKSAYRFVGGLLIETDSDTLRTELTTKRENVQARLDALAKRS